MELDEYILSYPNACPRCGSVDLVRDIDTITVSKDRKFATYECFCYGCMNQKNKVPLRFKATVCIPTTVNYSSYVED